MRQKRQDFLLKAFSASGFVLVALFSVLICQTLCQAPSDPPQAAPEAAPVSAPVDAPVAASPVDSPVSAPVAPPMSAPQAAPVAPPVAAPVQGPVAAPTSSPVAAPISAPVTTPVSAPVDAPVAIPVVAPSVSPVSTPAASPASPPTAPPTSNAPRAVPVSAPPRAAPVDVRAGCNVNRCTYSSAVNATNVYFGGSLGAKYSPACIRADTNVSVIFFGDFNAHPLAEGAVVNGVAIQTVAPVVGGSLYFWSASTPGVYPFYSTTLYAEGMMGAIYVGDACFDNSPVAPVPQSAPRAVPPAETPAISSLYSCEINGCTTRTTKHFGAPKANELGQRAIEFGGSRGYRFSYPCLYISPSDTISFVGDFSQYPLRVGVADGTSCLTLK